MDFIISTHNTFRIFWSEVGGAQSEVWPRKVHDKISK